MHCNYMSLLQKSPTKETYTLKFVLHICTASLPIMLPLYLCIAIMYCNYRALLQKRPTKETYTLKFVSLNMTYVYVFLICSNCGVLQCVATSHRAFMVWGGYE